MINHLFGLFSYDIGIDLGTANTLVLIRGKGIAIREPSFVARHKKTKDILAIGKRAKSMMGKTPPSIEVIRPLRDGVIADFDATVSMLTHFIRAVHKSPGILPKIPKPRVAVGIPSGVTPVERRAVADAVITSGAREVMLIEEPLAAALGAGLPVTSSTGSFVVDMGAGTTEMAVISLGGIVLGRSVRVAGDKLDQAIMNYFRLKYSLLIGEATAENLKIELGSATSPNSSRASSTTSGCLPVRDEFVTVVRGRDLESGLPRSIRIHASEVREAILPVLQNVLAHIEEILEETPPELVSDVMENGIILAGGGALMERVDQLYSETLKLPVYVANDPLDCVVRGCGRLLDDPLLARQVRITTRMG